jgi:ATP-binding cassette subfamily B protein
VAVVSIPLSLWTIRTIAARSKAKFLEQWAHTGGLNAQVEETFTGHAIVKAFGRQHEVEERFRQTNDELFDASFGAQFVSGVIQPAMMLLGNLNFVAIAVLGGVRVSSGTMSLGDVQAFLQYSRQFSMPLTHIASMINVFQSGVASAERIFELLDAPDQTPDEYTEPTTTAARGRVEFDHVSFSYDPSRPLITDLSLIAEPGRTVAIVGPTGAGKTTLVNLISAYLHPDDGQILLYDQDITFSSVYDRVRAGIARSFQLVNLFDDMSAFDNVALAIFSREGKTHNPVRLAERDQAVTQEAVDLLAQFGLQAKRDVPAGGLAQGERKLLDVAMAYALRPKLLFLDEPTSGVSTRDKLQIMDTVSSVVRAGGVTAVVIEHDMDVVFKYSDRIVAMHEGRILADGTPDEIRRNEVVAMTLLGVPTFA